MTNHCCDRRHCHHCGSHDLVYGPRQGVYYLYCNACKRAQT